MKRWGIVCMTLLLFILLSGCSEPLIHVHGAHRTHGVHGTHGGHHGMHDVHGMHDGYGAHFSPQDIEANSNDEASKVQSQDGLMKVAIQATKYNFDIQEIRVKQGDTVEITLNSEKGYHTLKIEGYNVEVKNKRTVSFVADNPGEFVFRCGVVCGSGHHEMTGVLIVE